MVQVNRGQGKYDFEGNELKTTKCVRIFIVFGVIVIIVAFIALITAVALLSTSSGKNEKKICVTKSCVRAASTLLQAMNTTIDPCEDFYEFTCSNWIKEHKFLDPTGTISIWDIIQKQVTVDIKEVLEVSTEGYPRAAVLAIEFYINCLSSAHKANVQHLQPIFKLFGGWPIAEGDKWDETKFNLDEAIATIVREIGMSTIIDISVEIDFKNKSRHMIFIDQPDKSEENHISEISTKKTIMSLAHLLGNNNTEQMIEDLEEMEELETIIANLSREDHERQNISTLFNVMTIEKLQASYPQMNWLKIFQHIFQLNEPNKRKILKTDEISVSEPKYLAELMDIIANNTFQKRTFANYFGWKIIEDMIYLFPNKEDVFFPELNDSSDEPSLTEKVVKGCIDEISDYMPTPLQYLYYKQNTFDENKILEMVSTMKDAFKHRVQYSSWIENDMKNAIKEKVNTMIPRIGVAKWMLDSEKLDAYYKDMPDMTDDTLKNIFNIANFTAKKGIARLYRDPSEDEWFPPESIKEVNAYNVPYENAIVIPASVLFPPLYDEKRPWYLNFGAIGAIIAHEITHGFDNTGKDWDKNGVLNKNWGSPNFGNTFEKQAQCFVDQYSKYKVFKKHEVDGKKTLGENIADNGGLQQAYLAYKMWEKKHGSEPGLPGLEKYTAEQLLFISFGMNWCRRNSAFVEHYLLEIDEHSPPRYRVIGSVSNSKQFAEAFGCKKSSSMNPPKKCTLW